MPPRSRGFHIPQPGRGSLRAAEEQNSRLTTLPQMLLRRQETEKPDREKESRAITKS